MRYGIGLDIGIESVGFAVVELDGNDSPFRIERIGARVFDKAEHPKTGSSLAAPRREARGARRRLRRHRHRLERIRGLIVSSGILTTEELQHLYDNVLTDIYEIRTRALDEFVSKEEFARILIHLAQRRGYQSNRKQSEGTDAESGKILMAVAENKERCLKNGYRTVGEMFYKDEEFSQYKRNKAENYKGTVDRQSVENEAKLIFAAQRQFGAVYANEEVEAKYLDILLSQRSFAEGPACGPYSGNQVDRMRGKCTFEFSELRASKASYSFQVFNLCQHINHIRIIKGGETVALSDEERLRIFDLAHTKSDINFSQIRKELKLNETDRFTGVRYDSDDYSSVEKKTKLKDLEIYYKIRKSIVDKTSIEDFESLTHDDLDEIGEALCKNLSDDKILDYLLNAGIPEKVAVAVLGLPNFAKFGHLSVKACKNILPYLKNGLTYDKACECAGYNFKALERNPQKFLPPLPIDCNDITSPVVKRAISQTIKVVNAIIREMGNIPVYVNIELARELSRDFDERKKIRKSQDENEKNNDRIMTQLREYSDNPSGQDLIKFKLWEEQAGRCMYSGEAIEISRITEPGYVEVDHIVPYSISFDDRMLNKVLVFTNENRQKGNRLPLQYLTGEKRDSFIIRVNQSHLKHSKKTNLLKEYISDEAEWKLRNLQDTQFISSFVNRYIMENLEFSPSAIGRKRQVTAVNGAITSYVRKRWGIKKIRENGDLHHAVDATVVACITQSMINRISKYSYYKETKDSGDYIVDPETGEAFTRFPTPWEYFLDELEIRLNQNDKKLRKMLSDVNYSSYLGIDLDAVKSPFVSRMSNHKVTGAAHKATNKSGKLEEQGYVVFKSSLTELKLDKNGEINGYYNPDSDRLLYEALKTRLQKFGGDGEKAFKDFEFRKPKSDGTPGPVVKKVKIYDTASKVVRVQNNTAVAENETMVRCDVFYVDGDGYYFVPIYVADTVKPTLPNSAPTQSKDANGCKIWKTVSDEDFKFSLYPNDLIRIVSKGNISVNRINNDSTLPEKMCVDGDEGLFLYYKGMDVSTAVLSGVTHDNTYKHRSIGKSMLRIEKYEVDVLGNIRRVEKETRKDFFKRK